MRKVEKAAVMLERLRVQANELNGIIEDGRFYRLPLLQRHSMVWSINSQYRKLLHPSMGNELKLLLPAASLALAVSCSVAGTGGGTGTGNDIFKAPVSGALGMVTAAADDLTFPFLNDLDGDGDIDLVNVTYGTPEVTYYQNVGTPSSPSYAAPVDALTNFLKIPSEDAMFSGDFGDIDGDNKLDLVTIDGSGANPNIVYHANSLTGLSATATVLKTNTTESLISTADLDGDGDLDIIQMPYILSGTASSGYEVILNYYENTGTPLVPDFTTAVVPRAFGLAFDVVETVGYSVIPRAVDFDGDGDLDLFLGCYTEDASSPGLYFVENTGTSSVPVFGAPTLNPFDFTPVSNSYDAIALGDLDNDGDIDLIAGDYYTDVPAGTNIKPELYYYENSKF